MVDKKLPSCWLGSFSLVRFEQIILVSAAIAAARPAETPSIPSAAAAPTPVNTLLPFSPLIESPVTDEHELAEISHLRWDGRQENINHCHIRNRLEGEGELKKIGVEDNS